MKRNNFLVYELILDKKIKRQIDLMLILKNNIRMSIIDLASLLDVNERTIISDVNHLGERRLLISKIFVEKGFAEVIGVNNQLFYEASFELIKDTLSYRLINYVYDQPVVEIGELSRIIHSSPTAIRSKIKEINSVIKKRFDCKLSSYNGEMKGSEVNIRYFFYSYFNELQLYFNVSRHTDNVANKAYSIYNDKLVKKMVHGIDCSVYHLEQLLVITVDRIRANRIINIEVKNSLDFTNNASYELFEGMYRYFLMKQFEIIDVRDGELFWAFISWLDTIVYSKHSSASMISFKNRAASNDDILNFVERAFAAIKIDDSEHDKFIELICSFINNQMVLATLSPLFQQLSREVKHLVKKNLTNAYRFWYELLETQRSLYPRILQDDIACKLAMISSQFTIKNDTKCKKVLFSLMGESGVVTYIETLIRKIFTGHVETIFVFNKPISEKMLDEENPDYIICNYKPLIGNNIDYISVSYLPTESEWVSVISSIIL